MIITFHFHAFGILYFYYSKQQQSDYKTEGTTTEVDTQNLLVKDNIIRINDDETGPGVSANAAGIEIFRGPGQDHATIMWDEASGKFEFRLGASTVDLTFGAAGTPADSIGYDQLKINDAADPGPATNTFLQSAGDGNFEFAVVSSDNFPVSGAISGTLASNTLQNYSVTTQKIADKAITSAKFDTSISFVGTTVIFNPGDILTAINGAGYFNLTNPNINLPTNVVDSGNIQDGSVTGFKLANSLDLSTKTLTYPNDITFQNLTISGNLTVNGTTTTINTALETSEGLEITPSGQTVGLLINSTSTGHHLQIQDDSVDTFLVKDGGDVVLQNLAVEKGITEKLGTSTVSGTTITVDLATGNHFVVDLEGLTGDISTFTVNNTNSTSNMVSSFTMKVIQGTTTSTRNFTWASLTAFKWPGGFGDGSLLDIDFGTYPYVTSSNTISGQIFSGTGFGIRSKNIVLGIAKAYTTRVGSGPFPTELNNSIGDYLVDKGKEYGTVTQRKRRCGWFDSILVKQSVKINGINNIILTKLDVLDELNTIDICVGYEINGHKYDYLPFDEDLQKNIKPIYKTINGWNESTVGVKSWSKLPLQAKKYINTLEKLIDVKISIISTGPERNQTIDKINLLNTI